MNVRLYILNLNLFQELNHYNNIAIRISWILFLSIYYNIVCCLDFFYKKKK